MPPSATDLKKTWAEALVYLKGRTIANVLYMEDENLGTLGWDRAPVVIVLDDGTSLYPSQDDEGNGPGALFIDLSKDAEKAGVPMCAPVI